MGSNPKKLYCNRPSCEYETIHPTTYKRHISTLHNEPFLSRQRRRMLKKQESYGGHHPDTNVQIQANPHEQLTRIEENVKIDEPDEIMEFDEEVVRDERKRKREDEEEEEASDVSSDAETD